MAHIIEKEIKILDIDVDVVIQRLKSMDAQETFSWEIHDIYYDTATNKLEKEWKRLRIRKKWDTYIVTMKKKLDDTIIRSNDEREEEVESFSEADKLIQSYNCRPTREKRKTRISYSLWTVHFDIDIYSGIPPLLEIEANSKEEIFLWIERLGLEKKTTASYGSRSLFKAYKIPYSMLKKH